jgi:hypothetical protein
LFIRKCEKKTYGRAQCKSIGRPVPRPRPIMLIE